MCLAREINNKIRDGLITLEQGLSFHLMAMSSSAVAVVAPSLVKECVEAIKNANNNNWEALVNPFPGDGFYSPLTTEYYIKHYQLERFLNREKLVWIELTVAVEVKEGMTDDEVENLAAQIVLDHKNHHLITIYDTEIAEINPF